MFAEYMLLLHTFCFASLSYLTPLSLPCYLFYLLAKIPPFAKMPLLTI